MATRKHGTPDSSRRQFLASAAIVSSQFVLPSLVSANPALNPAQNVATGASPNPVANPTPRRAAMNLDHFVQDCIAANGESDSQAAVLEVLAKALFEGDTAALPVDAIHSVTNPLLRFAGGIHIYGGDFFATTRSQWNPETLDEEPSDGDVIRGIFERENERLGI